MPRIQWTGLPPASSSLRAGGALSKLHRAQEFDGTGFDLGVELPVRSPL